MKIKLINNEKLREKLSGCKPIMKVSDELKSFAESELDDFKKWVLFLNKRHHSDTEFMKNLNSVFTEDKRIDGQETIYGVILDSVTFEIRESEMGIYIGVNQEELFKLACPKNAFVKFVGFMEMAVDQPDLVNKKILVDELGDKTIKENNEIKAKKKI